ncbi:MAG: hypothetical protein GY861_23050, partial [bacterium]|nr:hypothetical protein [bacterium]
DYLVLVLAGSLIAFVAAAVLTKSFAPDTYVFAPWFGGLIGLGAVPIVLFFNFINRELSSYLCDPNKFCYMPKFVAVLICSGLAITWVMTCIKSWRTGSE